MTSMRSQHFGPEYMNGPSLQIQHCASDSKTSLWRAEGRIQLQTAQFCFRWPHLASDGRVLLQTITFCFIQPNFASNSRFLLWTAALWLKKAMNRDVSIGPLTWPFTHLLAPLTHSLAPRTCFILLALCRTHLFAHSLTHSRAHWKVNYVSKQPGFVPQCAAFCLAGLRSALDSRI